MLASRHLVMISMSQSLSWSGRRFLITIWRPRLPDSHAGDAKSGTRSPRNIGCGRHRLLGILQPSERVGEVSAAPLRK